MTARTRRARLSQLTQCDDVELSRGAGHR